MGGSRGEDLRVGLRFSEIRISIGERGRGNSLGVWFDPIVALVLSVCVGMSSVPCDARTDLQDCAKPGQLDPHPPGTASLYRTPWRSNVRTVAALDALDGIGVYWKHLPDTWTQDQQTNVMRQMFAAGVRRARLAPHLALSITKDWHSPQPTELETLRAQLRASKAAGIRPCVTFVHIPPVGRAGTRDLQDWWRQGALMPAGDVGSPQFNGYLDKTYEALRFVLDGAHDPAQL